MFGELMRWSPAEELSNWHRDIDDLFGRFFQRKDSDYVVQVDLPGVDPKDVHVEAEGNLLSITGKERPRKKDRNIGKLSTENLNGGSHCHRAWTLARFLHIMSMEVLNFECPYRRSSLDGKFRFRLGKRRRKENWNLKSHRLGRQFDI